MKMSTLQCHNVDDANLGLVISSRYVISKRHDTVNYCNNMTDVDSGLQMRFCQNCKVDEMYMYIYIHTEYICTAHKTHNT